MDADRTRTSPRCRARYQQVQDSATQFLAKLNRIDVDALSRSLTGLVKNLDDQSCNRRPALDVGPRRHGVAGTLKTPSRRPTCPD